MHETIIILDFGSQYTNLIARRIREQNVYCEVYPYNIPLNTIRGKNPKGLVLSGGPMSIYEEDAPKIDKELFSFEIPLLGICYGLGVLADHHNGNMVNSGKSEYGAAELEIIKNSDLFSDIENKSRVWMSHADRLESLPDGFEIIGRTSNSPIAAIRNIQKKLYGIQFHPEVAHTKYGAEILRNFLFKICKVKGDWT
ncbi:glutamine-hydrolyzing GMP synthase, partial [candidate division KSB1 bacterium]|nr:glutamine-hydrolyzing GMP synthase [candidate division KSB1 bacterium]